MDPAESVHEAFRARLTTGDLPHAEAPALPAGLTPEKLSEMFASQALSRQLDRTARFLQARGEGFYTIGSSGHEGMAAVAEAFRVSDMAFLHYRDAAFQIQRSKKVPGQTPAWDFLLSFVASAEDPISGGRHKVLGSKALFIPPQTSTIASHLPKAMGAAYAVGLGKRLDIAERVLPDDAVIVASFGDASANHSTAQGAINAASWTAWQGGPMPIVFVCEDNGIGISVRTPRGWIEAAFANRPAVKYMACDGLDLVDTWRVASEAAAFARKTRRPVFLHMSCVRLYGHAGSDVQGAYLSKAEIKAAEAADPLLRSAGLLADLAGLEPTEILAIYDETGETVARVAEQAIARPKLTTAAEVMASLIPPRRTPGPSNRQSHEARTTAFGTEFQALDKPAHLARLINWALTDLMLDHGEIVLAGEDVGAKGGVYNVTSKLQVRFGSQRVIDTLLDEQSILGLAMGLAHNGMIPIPEIQFLAYVHNAEDQIRGEASTLSFFSSGEYTNPMIVRIAGLGYQRGFGGHFHNDNSIAALRDIPGVIIACPSNGADAVGMLRECVRLAREEQRVVVFLEPIALYMTRDLHAEKDGLWTFPYEPPGLGRGIALGEVGVAGEGTDLAIVSYANGYYLSRQAQKILIEQHDVDARVIDLRWLAPLDFSKVIEAIGPATRVLIVDECRITGSPSEGLMARLAEQAPQISVSRIAAEDSFIPLGRAATVTLPSRDSIVAAALAAAGGSAKKRRSA
ncbi:MAG TPA: thiamine pyrophosphate-dependent enzyme, partial [Caulobacteraceae bacterium]|nr:thiamine pyrophosphate-dependent enzyme [Caulobacteraceae bacterium]